MFSIAFLKFKAYSAAKLVAHRLQETSTTRSLSLMEVTVEL